MPLNVLTILILGFSTSKKRLTAKIHTNFSEQQESGAKVLSIYALFEHCNFNFHWDQTVYPTWFGSCTFRYEVPLTPFRLNFAAAFSKQQTSCNFPNGDRWLCTNVHASLHTTDCRPRFSVERWPQLLLRAIPTPERPKTAVSRRVRRFFKERI